MIRDLWHELRCLWRYTILPGLLAFFGAVPQTVRCWTGHHSSSLIKSVEIIKGWHLRRRGHWKGVHTKRRKVTWFCSHCHKRVPKPEWANAA